MRMLGEVRHFGLEALLASEGGDPGPGLLGDDNEVKARPPLPLPEREALPGHSTGTMGPWGHRGVPREEQGGRASAGWADVHAQAPRWGAGGGGSVERVRLVASGFARAAAQCPHLRGFTQQLKIKALAGLGPPEGPGEGVRPRPLSSACRRLAVFFCVSACSGPHSPLCKDDLALTPLQRLVSKQGHFLRSLGSGLQQVDVGLHFVLAQVTLSSEQG